MCLSFAETALLVMMSFQRWVFVSADNAFTALEREFCCLVGCIVIALFLTLICLFCAGVSDAEMALKMMMMTGSPAAAAVPLAALQAASHRQRLQQAAAASYLTSATGLAGLRHASATPLTAIAAPPTMYVSSSSASCIRRNSLIKCWHL